MSTDRADSPLLSARRRQRTHRRAYRYPETDATNWLSDCITTVSQWRPLAAVSITRRLPRSGNGNLQTDGRTDCGWHTENLSDSIRQWLKSGLSSIASCSSVTYLLIIVYAVSASISINLYKQECDTQTVTVSQSTLVAVPWSTRLVVSSTSTNCSLSCMFRSHFTRTYCQLLNTQHYFRQAP